MPDYCLESFGQEIGVNFQNNFSCMFNVGHVCANSAKKGQWFGRWIEGNGDVQIKIKATLFFCSNVNGSRAVSRLLLTLAWFGKMNGFERVGTTAARQQLKWYQLSSVGKAELFSAIIKNDSYCLYIIISFVLYNHYCVFGSLIKRAHCPSAVVALVP